MALGQDFIRLTLAVWPPDAVVRTSDGTYLGRASEPLAVTRSQALELTLELSAPYYRTQQIVLPPLANDRRFPDQGQVELQPDSWWVPAYTRIRLNPYLTMWGFLLAPPLLLWLLLALATQARRGRRRQHRARYLDELKSSSQDSRVGDRVDRWRLVEALGPDRYAAVLDEELLAGQRFELTMIGSLDSFQRAVQHGSQLSHPHVAKLEDYGDFEGTPYLVTELVAGKTLSELAPVPPEQARDLVPQILDGLSYVHAQGVLHRNLRPDCIRVREDGRAVLGDFTLAGRPVRSEASRTVTSEIVAPELESGGYLTPRADQYALGITLQRVLAPGLPPALEAVVTRMTCEDPNKRYPGVQEALDAWKAGLSPRRESAPAGASPAPAEPGGP